MVAKAESAAPDTVHLFRQPCLILRKCIVAGARPLEGHDTEDTPVDVRRRAAERLNSVMSDPEGGPARLTARRDELYQEAAASCYVRRLVRGSSTLIDDIGDRKSVV